jgi:hypothetical protein
VSLGVFFRVLLTPWFGENVLTSFDPVVKLLHSDSIAIDLPTTALLQWLTQWLREILLVNAEGWTRWPLSQQLWCTS